MRDPDLIVIETFTSQHEADLAKNALEAAGIDAMIKADTAGGMRPHLAWSSGGFQLVVREEDAAAAGDVLEPSVEAQLDEDE
jgi:hypothetical protein